jgi:hypothetical protein
VVGIELNVNPLFAEERRLRAIRYGWTYKRDVEDIGLEERTSLRYASKPKVA